MPRAALLALLALAACRQPAEPVPPPADEPVHYDEPVLYWARLDYTKALLDGPPLSRADSLRKFAVRDSLLDVLLRDRRTPCHVDDPVANYRAGSDREPMPPDGRGTRPGLPDTLLVRNGGPSVIVEYIGPEVGGDGYAPPLVMGLRLRWPRERRPFQTLPLGVAAMSGSANALDVDGDSYADLVYGVAFGTYVYDYVWLYRPAERRYGDGMTFTGALQVDPETGAVWSTWSVGLCCRTGVDLYTVRDGEARLIRQWVTDKYVMTSPDSTNFEVSATIVCERRGDEMAQVEVRPGEDRYDAPGDRD